MDALAWFALVVLTMATVAVISNVVDSTAAALLGVIVIVGFGVMPEVDAFKFVD